VSSATSAVSSGSGGVCDASLVCGQCQGCAIAGPCAGDAMACNGSPDCVAYLQCYDACSPNDLACQQNCGFAHVVGAITYNQFKGCLCLNCTMSCAGMGC
jgi:hypothetical protein